LRNHKRSDPSGHDGPGLDTRTDRTNPHRFIERTARAPAHGVENRTVDLGRTEARD
jgi:hypothetical protein